MVGGTCSLLPYGTGICYYAFNNNLYIHPSGKLNLLFDLIHNAQ